MDEKNYELDEQELDQTTGGGILDMGSLKRYDTSITNSKGQKVGEQLRTSIAYYPCDRCGKPMHLGTLGWWYCDPCNMHAYGPTPQTWTRSIGALKAASL